MEHPLAFLHHLPLTPVDMQAILSLPDPRPPGIIEEIDTMIDLDRICRVCRRLLPEKHVWRRYLDVLELALQGYQQNEIAQRLHCDPATVSRDMKNMRNLAQAFDATCTRLQARLASHDSRVFYLFLIGKGLDEIAKQQSMILRDVQAAIARIQRCFKEVMGEDKHA